MRFHAIFYFHIQIENCQRHLLSLKKFLIYKTISGNILQTVRNRHDYHISVSHIGSRMYAWSIGSIVNDLK